MKKMLIFIGAIVCIFVASYWFFNRLGRQPINQATKTCLVTGASSGIGKEIAREMVKRGWKVIGVARRNDKLKELEVELGQAFISYKCDVGSTTQIHEVSDEIKKQGLQPTLFFLNAGTGELEQKWQLSTAVHQRTFATNYFGVIAWIEEWLTLAKDLGGGTFVATSSVLALFATPVCAAYATSKIALVHCFDSLRRQYLYDNIGFSIALPGPTDTEMLKGAVDNLPFVHKPEDEAKYIIDGVFAVKQQIEPSWFYSCMLRVLNWLPDKVALKLL
ncbi:MAG: Short chain dehydrogenase [candidate division TM6 bacterium GW2011_GWF2_37_49]|nr:MAG: Short chain dehydrogenase [candidate division TM6 bacterium GW2011_GWF2_37_49]